MKREAATREIFHQLRTSDCVRTRHRHANPGRCVILLLCSLCCPAVVLGEDRPREEAAALRAGADAIRESADRLSKFRRIPWVTDVFEGFRLAREERRPVFLYVITGDPLEDC